jgi:hypothetical protein
MAPLTLTIVPRGTMTSFRVSDTTGRLVFATRAYSTEEGTQGARERLRAWMKQTGHRVVLREEVSPQRKVG